MKINKGQYKFISKDFVDNDDWGNKEGLYGNEFNYCKFLNKKKDLLKKREYQYNSFNKICVDKITGEDDGEVIDVDYFKFIVKKKCLMNKNYE